MPEKEKALEIALAQIERQFGKGAVMRLGSEAAASGLAVISSGSLSLDIATGVGGFPRGRIVEIYGPEASGKTTVALHALAEAQKEGGIAAFIDAEHALDPGYARNLGVDMDNLLVAWPGPLRASRPCKAPRHGCAARPSTAPWGTGWRPWCPGPRSKGRWATPT